MHEQKLRELPLISQLVGSCPARRDARRRRRLRRVRDVPLRARRVPWPQQERLTVPATPPA